MSSASHDRWLGCVQIQRLPHAIIDRYEAGCDDEAQTANSNAVQQKEFSFSDEDSSAVHPDYSTPLSPPFTLT
jgi:hypothetical protein